MNLTIDDLNCDDPRCGYDVATAHAVVQIHAGKGCRRGNCPTKHAAYRTLVDAGRVVPQSPRIQRKLKAAIANCDCSSETFRHILEEGAC